MIQASIPVNVNINIKGASIENPNSGGMNLALDTTVQSNMLDHTQSYMQKEAEVSAGNSALKKLKGKANLDIKASLAQDPSAVIS